jgi:fluoride exporter
VELGALAAERLKGSPEGTGDPASTIAGTEPRSLQSPLPSLGELLAVAGGGALGTLLRAGGLLAGSAPGDPGPSLQLGGFSWILGAPGITLLENWFGALGLGAISGLFLARKSRSPRLRLFLTTGLLGSFTTFSALAVDGVMLMGSGQPWDAVIYLLASIVGGLVLAGLGLRIGSGWGGGDVRP